MNRSSTVAIVASAALALALSVWAQQAPEAPAPPDPAPVVASAVQGNTKTDLKMTAKIHREINASNQMSANARNVTVITNAGKVTLQGPVDTATEKRLLEEIAVRTASPGNVENQLEVIAPK
jgi:BON domain